MHNHDLRTPRVNAKSYLPVIRALLRIDWLECRSGLPPTDIATLTENLGTTEEKKAIFTEIVRRQNGETTSDEPPNTTLGAIIQRRLHERGERAPAARPATGARRPLGVGDERRPLLHQLQAFDDVLRQDQGHGSGVDDAVGGRAADVGLLAVSAVEHDAVLRVLENDVGVNLSHRLHPLIVARSVRRLQAGARMACSARSGPKGRRCRAMGGGMVDALAKTTNPGADAARGRAPRAGQDADLPGGRPGGGPDA